MSRFHNPPAKAVRPQCLNVEGGEEGRVMRGHKTIMKPRPEEYEEHMRTHIPYRSWCPFCVMGKAKNTPHRKENKGKREIPLLAYDYMLPKLEEHKREDKTLPKLVGIDVDIGWISAYMVHKKGYDKHALSCLVRDVEQSGYNRLLLKGDQENSMKDIIEAVRRERAEDIDVMKENSAVGEHQENGSAERAVQTVQGQERSMKLALEHRYKTVVREDNPLWPWMTTHAAMLHNINSVGPTGRTPWELRRGRKFHRDIPEFGENVIWLKPDSLGRDKMESDDKNMRFS